MEERRHREDLEEKCTLEQKSLESSLQHKFREGFTVGPRYIYLLLRCSFRVAKEDVLIRHSLGNPL